MPDATELVSLDVRAGLLVATVNAAAIDSGNADRFAGAVHTALDGAPRRLRGLVLDLEAVSFINSRGLAACIDVARAAERAGARTAVATDSDDLHRMFTVMRVDRLLSIATDVTRATELVLGRPSSSD